MSKKLFIKTFGCQMNVYDSGRMTDLLTPLGYQTCATPEAADLVILNTCHIRAKAAEKVYSDLGRLRLAQNRRRAAGGRMVVAVAGCVAQAEGGEITRRAPHVDIVVGPQAYHRLPGLLERLMSGEDNVVDTAYPADSKFDTLPELSAPRGVSAYLTVQEGCDKFCNFCVVPYTRGAELSRPAEAVIAEARRLLAGGARELVLLGQNVNAYHGAGPDGRDWTLARLLQALAELPDLVRLRYTTSHPLEMTADLIAAHGGLRPLMPYLHLPVQSGADAMLKAMNRRHRRDDYLRVVEALRAARPDIALSSDFIVGYPGETDDDFGETLALVRTVGFAHAYSFKFSPRPGTPAAAAEQRQVSEAVKAARLAELQELLRGQQSGFNLATVGRDLPVLFERAGRDPHQVVGRSPYHQAVHADADDSVIGQVASVRIEAALANSLHGRMTGAARQ